jgi:hypothetical protein
MGIEHGISPEWESNRKRLEMNELDKLRLLERFHFGTFFDPPAWNGYLASRS